MKARRLLLLLALGGAGLVLPQSAAATFPGTNGPIAFASDRTGAVELFSVFPDGSVLTQLTTGAGSQSRFPDWSPDGTMMTFISNRDRFDVYSMNSNGTAQALLTTSAGADVDADWGPLVTPPFAFTDFFSPVDNPPVVNSVKAGQAIPIKFSLGGDQGLDIFEAGYPKSQHTSCDLNAAVDGVESTVSAGGGSLSYDAATDAYTYVWKSLKAWAGTCRQVVLRLGDGTRHRANFAFN